MFTRARGGEDLWSKRSVPACRIVHTSSTANAERVGEAVGQHCALKIAALQFATRCAPPTVYRQGVADLQHCRLISFVAWLALGSLFVPKVTQAQPYIEQHFSKSNWHLLFIDAHSTIR